MVLHTGGAPASPPPLPPLKAVTAWLQSTLTANACLPGSTKRIESTAARTSADGHACMYDEPTQRPAVPGEFATSSAAACLRIQQRRDKKSAILRSPPPSMAFLNAARPPPPARPAATKAQRLLLERKSLPAGGRWTQWPQQRQSSPEGWLANPRRLAPTLQQYR